MDERKVRLELFNREKFSADGHWYNVDNTCIQIMAHGADYVGELRVRHDPDCPINCHASTTQLNPGGPVNAPHSSQPDTQYVVKRLGFGRWRVSRKHGRWQGGHYFESEALVGIFFTQRAATKCVKELLGD